MLDVAEEVGVLVELSKMVEDIEKIPHLSYAGRRFVPIESVLEVLRRGAVVDPRVASRMEDVSVVHRSYLDACYSCHRFKKDCVGAAFDTMCSVVEGSG